MALFYALPLAEFIRRRVNGRPVSPPKVPAINARASVQMGKFDLALRRIGNEFKDAIAFLEQKQSISTTKHEELIESIGNVRDLLMEVREELRQVRLQLSSADSNAEDEEIFDENLSEFEAEDWE